jgi:GxxExxY protein
VTKVQKVQLLKNCSSFASLAFTFPSAACVSSAACVVCVPYIAHLHTYLEEETTMTENEISRVIYECAIEVHRALGGPGLLESLYEEALAWELAEAGLPVQRQKLLPVAYKGAVLATPLRIDLMVGEKVIVECKATAQYNDLFEAQVLTYLRLTGIKLGLVINFGEKLVKHGIHRVVNRL